MKRKKLWLSVLVGLLVLLVLYVGSYIALSAGGCYEPAGIGLGGVKWYAWAPSGFVDGYKWKYWPMLIYAPLMYFDGWLWHPPGPPPGNYPIDEVKPQGIWKVYKAHGFFGQKQPSDVVREKMTADEAEETSLNDKTDATLHVGSRASYTARYWPSVGYQPECSVGDESVIRLVTARLDRLHPENNNPGGDEARKVFCFVAVSKGTTAITIRKLFRGKLQETTRIKITVIE